MNSIGKIPLTLEALEGLTMLDVTVTWEIASENHVTSIKKLSFSLTEFGFGG